MSRRHLQSMVLFLTAILIFVVVSASHAGMNSIAGSIRFQTADGTAGSAAWTRVYLIRERVPIPPASVEHGLIPYAPTDRINTTHQQFYANVQEALARPNLLTASTLVDEGDGFRFSDIPPGRYYVLVAFPSSIDGYKVAWQVPVRVERDRTAEVTLTRDNLALPTFSRRDGAFIVDAGQQP